MDDKNKLTKRTKQLYMRNTTIKASVIWWLLTIIHISEFDEFEKQVLITIKKVFGVKRSVKQSRNKHTKNYQKHDTIGFLQNVSELVKDKTMEQCTKRVNNEIYFLLNSKWWHKSGYSYYRNCHQNIQQNIIQNSYTIKSQNTKYKYYFSKAVLSLNGSRTEKRKWTITAFNIERILQYKILL
eukprot:TRINITY_DN16413_c0_g1_i3.p1 TRINITY_DN16413_c0_g1~~TRINITY_DN16413_c0_g1_i3.p1  ORF type:complete len:196 (-),score=0.67 TRINITY_DN16413_c0_g1_i3:46-594(-)